MAIESVMHVRVDVGLFPSASRFRIFWMFDLCYLYHDFAGTVFYVEEFSILPCPACPTCQRYISVGIRADTFTDTVTCQVSEIKQCIRYDG